MQIAELNMEKLFCCRIHWNPSRSVLNRRSKISFILEFVASNQKLRYCSPTGLSRSHWSEVLVLRCDWTKNVYSPVRGSRPWATPVLAWPDWIFQSKSIKIWWRDALRLWIDSVLKIRQQIFTLKTLFALYIIKIYEFLRWSCLSFHGTQYLFEITQRIKFDDISEKWKVEGCQQQQGPQMEPLPPSSLPSLLRSSIPGEYLLFSKNTPVIKFQFYLNWET